MIACWPLWSTATSVTTTTITSSAVPIGTYARGFFSILAILSGTSPSVTITYKVGMKKDDTFYAPVDANGTDLSGIYASLTATKWISFSVFVPAPQIQISAVDANDSNVKIQAWLFFQEETSTD